MVMIVTTTSAATATWLTILFAVLASMVSVAAAALMRNAGWIRREPSRYFAHLVFLLTVATVPLLSRNDSALLRIAPVLGATGAIWLMALTVLPRIRS
jgi:hypothetical protein